MYMCIHSFRFAIILCVALLTTGCFGGTVAQQIVRTIATSVADSAVGKALEADESRALAQQPTIKNMPHNPAPDPYRNAMFNMAFTPIQAISEPLPEYLTESEETPIVILNTNPLVQVELFNLLIGNEKLAVLEKERSRGALNIPDQSEWESWQVATGKIQTPHQFTSELILFLLPPELGKLPSGSITTVEIATSGDMSIARYKSD